MQSTSCRCRNSLLRKAKGSLRATFVMLHSIPWWHQLHDTAFETEASSRKSYQAYKQTEANDTRYFSKKCVCSTE